MNAKWWDSLSKTDQMLITAASGQENDLLMAEYNANNGRYLAKLVNEHGVKLRQFSDEIYDSFGEASEAVFETARSHSPEAKEIHDSFADARREVGGWKKLSEGTYYQQRNRVLGI